MESIPVSDLLTGRIAPRHDRRRDCAEYRKRSGIFSLPISQRFAYPRMSGYSSSEPSPAVISAHCIPFTSKRIESFLR